MSHLDRAEVQKVAHLARLNLTPEEEIAFTTQLGSILDYFEQLSGLDTEGVAPTTRAIELSNVLRADELQPTVDREAMLQEAPAPEGDFFRVPQILGGED
ncbi:Asp-tRNA(Asn)/Glu-tRNA(Gln) amidotransferase subunit GatC [Spirulina sp. CCNP1310]|uniref:Asp-tRNA(Asn)/Glu-tRNA(Gln) amidotransferase subunit GatC n=1 Tax=Spirulina sp. CCNP1310 TaxID=3110249 RepID=UPI002B2011F7|nr:Asp-tRNA(Asn)/Glu-tRNA(Gln) amidotransferase subunit GatC [Spirulina sp. CCNP1310]MEA5419306.1 Asp-tRNA(Asn)/Glu-tRNA(Gln) amidotransferase subunit GatC [Spirulina sp. CCNP1310]